MKNCNIFTDLAIESASSAVVKEFCNTTEMSYGIKRHTLNVNTRELSSKVGKPFGVYITFDAPIDFYNSVDAQNAMSQYLSKTLRNLIGIVKRTSPVFVVGLGNKYVIADALGERVVKDVNVTRSVDMTSKKQSVCAFDVGVLGTTGMQSQEVVSAVCDKINPCCVIAVDSLATSVISRIGRSFQITTSGIVPSGGIGQDKPRICKEEIGVPVISIGVPLMILMSTALYDFVKKYTTKTGGKMDEFLLRSQLADNNLSNLVVAPKDIDFLVEHCAKIIAKSINNIF